MCEIYTTKNYPIEGLSVYTIPANSTYTISLKARAYQKGQVKISVSVGVPILYESLIDILRDRQSITNGPQYINKYFVTTSIPPTFTFPRIITIIDKDVPASKTLYEYQVVVYNNSNTPIDVNYYSIIIKSLRSGQYYVNQSIPQQSDQPLYNLPKNSRLSIPLKVSKGPQSGIVLWGTIGTVIIDRQLTFNITKNGKPITTGRNIYDIDKDYKEPIARKTNITFSFAIQDQIDTESVYKLILINESDQYDVQINYCSFIGEVTQNLIFKQVIPRISTNNVAYILPGESIKFTLKASSGRGAIIMFNFNKLANFGTQNTYYDIRRGNKTLVNGPRILDNYQVANVYRGTNPLVMCTDLNPIQNQDYTVEFFNFSPDTTYMNFYSFMIEYLT